MYIPPGPPKARTAVALASIVALTLLSPICGLASGRQMPTITPRRLSLAPSKILGMGLNCHSEKLPLDRMRALGIRWVRLDLQNYMTPTIIRDLVSYYRDYGQLWIDHHLAGDVVRNAQILVSCGVTDIEVINEPEQNGFPPELYAARFKAVQRAVGTSARLYGPAVGDWPRNKGYIQRAIAAGARPDVLSFHGYDEEKPEDFAAWVNEAKRLGVPVVISELAFPDYNGATPYRLRMHDTLGSLFLRTRKALQDTAWCWYDGPNPVNDNNSGLFDQDPRTKLFSIPNQNYSALLSAVSRG
jgi:hypothetical protein